MKRSIFTTAATAALFINAFSGVASAQSVSGGLNAGLTFGGGKPTTGQLGASATVEGKKASATATSQTQIGGQNSGTTTVNLNVQKK